MWSKQEIRGTTYSCPMSQKRPAEELLKQEACSMTVDGAERIIQKDVLGWGVDSTSKRDTGSNWSAHKHQITGHIRTYRAFCPPDKLTPLYSSTVSPQPQNYENDSY